MRFGDGAFQYEVIADWGRGAEIPAFGLVSGVACDSQDRAYVFIRLPRPEVLVFDRDGRLRDRWGSELFTKPHGIWISPDDHIYLTDTGDHTVRKMTPDGRVLMTLGTPGQTGAPGMPFNEPTRAVEAPSGDLFVSDGYGQNRAHRFTAAGERIVSWGETGKGPGQFELPHDITVDRHGRVYILDRPNGRCQLFNEQGEYQAEWTGFRSPNDLFITPDETLYVAEGGQRISVLNRDGEILARWGEKGTTPGQFSDSPHGIWVDSRGDLYVSEVIAENRFQKFVRI
jgi:DNA-binding beta-propeller fold protein YncE